MIQTSTFLNRPNQLQFRSVFGGRTQKLLLLYMLVVFGHFGEHFIQVGQVYILGWLPNEAGGILGLWFPALAAAEILHFSYNLLQLYGLVWFRNEFDGRSRSFWHIALGAQIWHLFEHALLQIQWLTGVYLFGASLQMSIGQLFLPRIELHFLYNLVVFIPTMVAVTYYARERVIKLNRL